MRKFRPIWADKPKEWVVGGFGLSGEFLFDISPGLGVVYRLSC